MNLNYLTKPITYLVMASTSQHYCVPIKYNIVDERLARIKNENLLSYAEPIKYKHSVPLENRVASFSKLKINWDGYGGVVPQKNVINNSLRFIQSLPTSLLESIEIDSIIPTPYGSIVIDFENGNNTISVEIGENKIGFFTDFQSLENISSDGILFNQQILPQQLTEAFQRFYQTKTV